MRAKWQRAVAMLACGLVVACGEAETSVPDGGTSGADGGVVREPCARVSLEAADLDNYDSLVECLRSAQTDATKQAALTTFLAAAESRDGFPIVGADRIVFVYLRSADFDREDDRGAEEDFSPARRNEPIRVAGDFNEWDADGAVLQREWGEFFHRSLQMIASPVDRWRYKLLAKDAAGGDVWFSDPLSRRFEFDQNGRISIVRGGQASGHLETLQRVWSSSLGGERDIYVYVPRGYDFGSARYPVLYMHDGNNLFDVAQPQSAAWSWDVDGVEELETTAGLVRPHLVVGIPNSPNRFGEYTHVEDAVEGQTLGGDGAKYARFLVEELKPLIDARYRTLPEREQTGILGSSLGGLVSYYVGLEHPEVFKYVGGMSSTFGWGAGLGNPTMLDLYGGTADLGARGQVYYLDSGGGPGGGCSMSAAFEGEDNYCDTLRMKAALEAKGVDTFPDDPNATHLTPAGIDIYHWHEAGAAHNEAAWNARLYRPLRLFFRP